MRNHVLGITVMSNPLIIIFSTGIVILAGMIYLSGKYADIKRKNRFADRADINNVEFFLKYYAKSGIDQDIVKQVRSLVAITLNIPSTKILPTDRFAVELCPEKGWEHDDGLFILQCELKKMIEKAKLQIEPSEIKTVDDCIRILNRGLKEPTL